MIPLAGLGRNGGRRRRRRQVHVVLRAIDVVAANREAKENFPWMG